MGEMGCNGGNGIMGVIGGNGVQWELKWGSKGVIGCNGEIMGG